MPSLVHRNISQRRAGRLAVANSTAGAVSPSRLTPSPSKSLLNSAVPARFIGRDGPENAPESRFTLPFYFPPT